MYNISLFVEDQTHELFIFRTDAILTAAYSVG